MIIDHVDSRPVPRYLIYDIVKFEVSIFAVHCSILNEDSTPFVARDNMYLWVCKGLAYSVSTAIATCLLMFMF